MLSSSDDTILIARHAETASNLARRYAGWSDESVTERGREQATDLARRVSGRGVSRIRSSCIYRAWETAKVVAGVLGVPVLPDERLNELRMGPWEGLTEEEVARRYPCEHGLWLARPDELQLDGRETLHQVASRLRAALADSAASGERELLITHVALVRIALLLAGGRPLAEYKQVCVPNCEWVEVAPPDQWRSVVELGGDGHRRLRVAAG